MNDQPLAGYTAMQYKLDHPHAVLRKYTDPLEDARVITLDEAEEIARDDPSLIYCYPTAGAPAPREDETMTPTDRVVDALLERGYRTLYDCPIPEAQQGAILGFRLYTNGVQVLCLQRYRDGGCELYRNMSDTMLGVAALIAAIPTREDGTMNYAIEFMYQAETQSDVDRLVNMYLAMKGELERSRHETYEETAERLDDDFMRAAHERWYALEDN